MPDQSSRWKYGCDWPLTARVRPCIGKNGRREIRLPPFADRRGCPIPQRTRTKRVAKLRSDGRCAASRRGRAPWRGDGGIGTILGVHHRGVLAVPFVRIGALMMSSDSASSSAQRPAGRRPRGWWRDRVPIPSSGRFGERCRRGLVAVDAVVPYGLRIDPPPTSPSSAHHAEAPFRVQQADVSALATATSTSTWVIRSASNHRPRQVPTGRMDRPRAEHRVRSRSDSAAMRSRIGAILATLASSSLRLIEAASVLATVVESQYPGGASNPPTSCARSRAKSMVA